MPCDVELLAGIAFFELLDEHEREALAAVLDHVSLPAGQTLYTAGEPGDDLYVVRGGAVELSVKDITGQKIVLHVAREGELFGALALVEGEPRPATAAAVEPTSLLLLDRDDLLLLFRQHPEAALAMLAALGSMTRRAGRLLQTRVSRNVNDAVEEQQRLSPLVRFADFLAWFSGSMPFLLLHTLWFTVWISLNTLLLPRNPDGTRGFDPFPFGLLTMIVSLEAIFLSCFVLISANRQAEKDKVRADIEYEVNIKAELEVAHLHEKTDMIYEAMLERFARLEKALPHAAGGKV
jgi:uncharacterized membrane protein